MKVRPSVKPICEKCKVIKRKGKVMESARILSTNNVRANKPIMEVQLNNGSYCWYRPAKG